MKYKIRWTSNAYSDFSQIVHFIKETWGKTSAEEFINQIDNLTVILSIFPYLRKTIHSGKQIRAFVLSKQITIIYRLKNNNIDILNLFDNRQNSDKLKINEPLFEYYK